MTASGKNQSATDAESAATGFVEAMALLAILALSLFLRLWGLEQNGWGAEYYTSAVRSMAANWHNFFYVAFDPAGFISVDKPPVALWLQVASVKLFGFEPLSVLVPQAVMGAASVGVLYLLVRRRFSAAAGLLAALFLAITPVFVAVNRTNNTDSCLVLVLLLAAWALLKAAEEGRRPLLLLSMALVGLAFNVKMLAAFIVLPTFFLAYLAGAPHPLRRRILDLMLAGVVVVATALPWMLFYELTPVDQRPFVGSSTRNSMLELAVGHNALGRFAMRSKTSDGAGRNSVARQPAIGASSTAGPETTGERRRDSMLQRLFVRAPTGLSRLINGQLAAQAGWLLPLAVMALVISAFQSRIRRPPTPAQLNLLFWFCWMVTYGLVYSYAGGIIHFYYLSTFGPALAGLAGIGVAGLWECHRRKGWQAVLLPVTLLMTAAWQLYLQADALGWNPASLLGPPGDWLGWLHAVLTVGTLAATAMLLVRSQPGGVIAKCGLATGLVALLAIPTAWALSSVLIPGYGMVPSADLYRLSPDLRNPDLRPRGRFGHNADIAKLADFLVANRNEEKYLLATTTTQIAAPIIIHTGQPVMAMGGFHGLDPAMTPEEIARLAENRQVRFVLLGDASIVSRRMGADAAGRPVAEWVRTNGKPVPAQSWRSPAGGGSSAVLYDLRPDYGVVPGLAD